jgi:hypothetical protein
VLYTVAILPHPTLPGFKWEVTYNTAMILPTTMDLANRQALGCLLAQYRGTFEIGELRLLPRDYWRLAPLVDRVPSHEGLQDDVDVAPFRESDKTLVETASYLVDLDKYTHHLENESLNLFGDIKDATTEARHHLLHCLELERENHALRYRVRQLEQGVNYANTTLLQVERERVATHEELLHIKEDLCKMTVSQSRLRDRLQSKNDLLMVCGHLLGCKRNKVKDREKCKAENTTNLVWIIRMTVYLRDKAERLKKTWEDIDSLRVKELMDINGDLPSESQHAIRTETFELPLPSPNYTCVP